MALGDPFASTEETMFKGRMAGQEAAMGGVTAVGNSALDIAKMKYQQKLKQQGFQTMKDMGLITENPPSRQQKEDAITSFAKQNGRNVDISKDTPDSQLDIMIKTMGVKMPKGTISIQPGAKLDLTTGEASIEGQKPESEETKAMKEMTMQLRQEDEERKQREEEEKKSEFQQKQQEAKDTKEQKAEELQQGAVKQATSGVYPWDAITNPKKYQEAQQIQENYRKQVMARSQIGQIKIVNGINYKKESDGKWHKQSDQSS